jgi:KipI family sensor histidine kinase inhibitor
VDIKPSGDRAIIVEFGSTIDPALVARVRSLDEQIASRLRIAPDGAFAGVLETVPTFRSLAIVFDPLVTTPEAVALAIRALPTSEHGATGDQHRAWKLPVIYGGEFGPDLDEVARTAQLEPEEVISRHINTPVSVYLLGFMPGFAFMGDTDAQLQLPRRTEPRVRVPAGSVGLALTLTAIYPWQSPGGWHLIGHSPVPLFDPNREKASLLAPGDSVSFYVVEEEEHADLVDQLKQDASQVAQFLDEGDGGADAGIVGRVGGRPDD